MQTVSTMGRQCLLGADSVYRLHGCFLLNPSEHTTSKEQAADLFGLFSLSGWHFTVIRRWNLTQIIWFRQILANWIL